MFKKLTAFLFCALFCALFSGGAWAALPVTNGSNININGAPVTAANPLPIASQGTAIVLQVADAANLITGQATAAGATTIGTPPANSNMRLLHVEIPGNAIQATAGDDLITIALNGVTVATLDPYIPAASLGTGTLYTTVYNFDPVAFNTGSAGTLTVTLATALTGGAVNVNAYFD